MKMKNKEKLIFLLDNESESIFIDKREKICGWIVKKFIVKTNMMCQMQREEEELKALGG